jgi:hypothetical protein
MKTIYVIFKCDTWHTRQSFDLIGVATTKANMIKLAKEQAKKEGERLSRYTVEFLADKLQTQDYEGEGEFYVEAIQANTLQ